MEKKLKIIIELVIFVILVIYISIKVVLPEVRQQFGSSDKFINTSHYQNMFEIKIDNNIRFALAINDKKEIYHIMFLEYRSTCLYNQDIEGNELDLALSDVFRILISKNYINDYSNIVITRYGDTYYSDFINSFNKLSNKHFSNIKIIEEKNTLSNLRDELQLDYSEDDSFTLKLIDLYSKEYSRQKKNNMYKSEETDSYITEYNSKKYTDNVYKKIEKFVLSNNISSMDKGDLRLQISLIPADESLKYYPSNNSWFYVIDGKVYAYIEIIDNDISYNYCYNGSIDLNKKGECV